jgi:hypothetical protein
VISSHNAQSFEETLGVVLGSFDRAGDELKRLKLGSEAQRERREKLAQIIVEESIAATGAQFVGKSLEVERRLRYALVQLVLTGRQWPSLFHLVDVSEPLT